MLDFYKPLESDLSTAEPDSTDNCCQPSGDECAAEHMSSTEVCTVDIGDTAAVYWHQAGDSL